MKVSSSAFKDDGTIPTKYARQAFPGGQNVSIPVSWEGAPDGTRSFALSFIDVSSNDWVHWMVIDIPADVASITEGASGANMPQGSRELVTTFGSSGYGGPQPPQGTGVHNYVVTVYALDVTSIPRMPERPSAGEFEEALKGSVLSKATLTGKLGR